MKTNILENAKLICNNFNANSEDIKLTICNDEKKLAKFYKTYNGIVEFLYIAPEEEIKDAINNGAIYFTVLYKNKLAGVCKASRLELPYPFFNVPKTMDKNRDYFGLSGLYIHEDFRGLRLSTLLLKASTALAEECKAAGIYADFDYRNIASMRLVSKYYNLLGYTDGRNGSPDEATIYTTFFKTFDECENKGILKIFFEQIDCNNARQTLDFVMEKVGESSIKIVKYCEGYNEIVCFDKPYSFETSNIEIIKDITKDFKKENKTLDK